jgi:hypothetical protein
MLKTLKGLIIEEDGISTVEIVVIIAILIGIALLFRKSINAYVAKVCRPISFYLFREVSGHEKG